MEKKGLTTRFYLYSLFLKVWGDFYLFVIKRKKPEKGNGRYRRKELLRKPGCGGGRGRDLSVQVRIAPDRRDEGDSLKAVLCP